MPNIHVSTMELEFIGQDGLHDLRHGAIYKCDIWTSMGYIWVSWTDGIPYECCPYGSFKRFLENWRVSSKDAK